MPYPYPSLVDLLQFKCDADEYQRSILPLIDKRGVLPRLDSDYWRVIPTYTYAFCPICHTQCQEPADTNRLWPSYDSLRNALYFQSWRHRLPRRCPHFLGIHQFVNLHNTPPQGSKEFVNHGGEVPHVTPWFIPDEIDSYVILHALPLCRIESHQFVPSYTVFNLTYFSQDPKGVLKRHYETQAKFGRGDPDFYPLTVSAPGNKYSQHYNESQYNLNTWAANGRLGWLEFKPDVQLKLEKNASLPEIYQNISGLRERYIWKENRTQIF